MAWQKPEATDLRFGFEITMYIANRSLRVDYTSVGRHVRNCAIRPLCQIGRRLRTGAAFLLDLPNYR